MDRIIAFIFIFCFSNLLAQQPVFEWVLKHGAYYSDSGNLIEVDLAGNIYYAGYIYGTMDFDPGPEVYTIGSDNESANFIAKYNQQGELDWAVTLGPSYNGLVASMKIDSMENVYLAGTFGGTLDFFPGAAEFPLTSFGNSSDAFVLKLNQDGEFVWAKNFGGLYYDVGKAIAVTKSGDIFLTGAFSGVAIFDTEPEPVYLTAIGNQDIFIAKLDSNGDLIWAKNIGGLEYDYADAIALDGDNNVITMGKFRGSVDFDPGPGQFALESHTSQFNISDDLFVLKLNAEGDFIWAKHLGGSSSSLYSDELAIDKTGAVYLSAWINGNVDVDPGTSDFYLSEQSGYVIIVKLNDAGELVWARQFSQGGGLSISAITVDDFNNIYTTGRFSGAADMDPGSDAFYIPDATNSNIFMLKLDADGIFVNAIGVIGTEYAYFNSFDIALDQSMNIYMVGLFDHSVDFDINDNIHEESSVPEYQQDAFLLKMSQEICPKPLIQSSTSNLSICPGDSSLILLAEMPYDVGDVIYSWENSSESDSLHINPDSNTTYSLIASYVLNGIACICSDSVEVVIVDAATVTIPDDFSACYSEYIILEATGGESYVWNWGSTMNTLHIYPTIDETYYVTMTDWNGCTDVDSVHIDVYPITQPSFVDLYTCDTFAVVSFYVTYQNQYGCDSLVYENYSLLPVPQTPILADTIWLQPGDTVFQIFAFPMAYATAYIWQLPPSAQIISGDSTNHVFINWGSTANSDSVCVSAGNECGQSAFTCKQVVFEMPSAVTTALQEKYTIFPNPNSGLVYVLSQSAVAAEYELRTLSGQLMLTGVLQPQTQLDFRQVPQGVYLLVLKTPEGIWVEKMVKL